MGICTLWETCPFYESVMTSDATAGVLKEYVEIYCYGPMERYCQRRLYFQRNGKALDAKISPSGLRFE